MSQGTIHVYAKIPRAGLGNKLFIWARAVVFSKLHGVTYSCWGWSHFSWGPYLRGELIKRNYRKVIGGNHTPFREQILLWFCRLFNKSLLINDPPILKQQLKPGTKVVFSLIPHWSDYFEYIKNYRSIVKNEVFNLATAEVKRVVDSSIVPFFSVHIRLGDFKKLPQGTDFKSVGNTRTPLDYFVHGITNVRAVVGRPVPVSVFTDGRDEELEPVLNLENVKIVRGNPDLADLLIMSKSKVIMTSASSTFGYWAAFLSEAIVLMHPDHIHQPLRDQDTNDGIYEGPLLDQVKEWPPLLMSNLALLKLNKL